MIYGLTVRAVRRRVHYRRRGCSQRFSLVNSSAIDLIIFWMMPLLSSIVVI